METASLVFLLHITLAECLKQIETYSVCCINDIDYFGAVQSISYVIAR